MIKHYSLILGNGDGKALKSTENIQSHISDIKSSKTIKDNSEKPHSCSFCKRTFGHKKDKIIHERNHTGEKPFTCDICNKSYSNPTVFNRHKKLVHSEEKPYPCNYCASKYKENSNLKRHVLTTHAGGTYTYLSLLIRSAGIIIFHGLQMRVLN